MTMPLVNITELRKYLPSYIKRVSKGEEFAITSHGKVVARIVPENDPAALAEERLRKLRGTAIVGDVVAPLDTVWSGDSDNL